MSNMYTWHRNRSGIKKNVQSDPPKEVPSPLVKKGKAVLKKERTTLPFRGDNFVIEEHYYVCLKTRETFVNDALLRINLGQVYDQYASKYGVPSIADMVNAASKKNYFKDIINEKPYDDDTYAKYATGEISSLEEGKKVLEFTDICEFFDQVKKDVAKKKGSN